MSLRALALGLLAAPLFVSGAVASSQEEPGTPWGADYFPNVELTTHEGRRVRFFDDLVRGKVVVINFIYTTCADACPLETARLVEVQDVLGERVGRDVHFYSISIDPARDTPEVLARYAERFQTGPGWLFLTGAEEDVRRLRNKLGVLGADETELQDHSLNLVIGNQLTGRWMRRSPFENAFVLADEIGSWLHNWTAPPAEGFESAPPELRSIGRGESLFRTRCSACHAIGTGDGLVRVGPNLLHVTARRERAWLERWLKEPDRMLAEGEPLARALFESANRITMPNLRLNELEVAALLDFLDEESQRLALAASGRSASASSGSPVAPAQDSLPSASEPSCCLKPGNVVLSADDEPPASAVDPAGAGSLSTDTEPLAPSAPAEASTRAWVLPLLVAGFLCVLGALCGPARGSARAPRTS